MDRKNAPPLQRSRTSKVIALGQIIGVSDVDEVSKTSNRDLIDQEILEKLKLEVEIAQLQDC